ncbi:MAG: ATP-binding cassette domain-containing protein [Cryobacterium sp.]|nr:ATP-binding cassette domain-containing protein [Cryobacterium sp.]
MSETVLEIQNATLTLGERTIWSSLDLSLGAGEFLAVIGPNGSGKTSLLKAILGRFEVNPGSISVFGGPVARSKSRIGYIPQQRSAEQSAGLRGQDLVALGIDGHVWGPPIRSKKNRDRVAKALEQIGAEELAKMPVGLLSGGQQQRLRVAQALVGDPGLLLCDEPFLSLDLKYQQKLIEVIQSHRRQSGMSVVFVTHDVNPILGMADRILYFTGGKFLLGTPAEVLDSEVLSEVYGTKVQVVRESGRVNVIGLPAEAIHHHELEGEGL